MPSRRGFRTNGRSSKIPEPKSWPSWEKLQALTGLDKPAFDEMVTHINGMANTYFGIKRPPAEQTPEITTTYKGTARRQYCKILRKFEHEWPLDMIAEIQYWRHASVMRFNQGHQRPQPVDAETPFPHVAVTAVSPRKAPRAR